MIFGDKFFLMLRDLSPWRQSLFALVLAQRQYPNYALWCDVNNVRGGKKAYAQTLDTMWEFHTDKFNHIDLEKLLDDFEPYLLKDEEKNLSVGDLYSLDATLSLSAAILAIILHEGEEAEMACRASLGGVVRKIEQDEDAEFSDEQLREMPSVDDEVSFQVEVLNQINNSPRSKDLTLKLKKMALRDGLSNIGLSLED